MMLHGADMVRQNITKIRIVSYDTDIIIFLALFHAITNLKELWITFGTGKAIRFFPIHTIARRVGAKKCEALFGFPASPVVTVFLHFMEQTKCMLGIFGVSFLQFLGHFVSYPIL